MTRTETRAPIDQATRLRALMETARTPMRTRRPPPPPTQGPARVLAVASGKGGVGKTTLAVNLSISLASHAMRTTLLDADMGTANADLLCGISPRRRLDAWLEAARGAAAPSIDGLVVQGPGGFQLVPGVVGLARTLDSAQRQAIARGVEELERRSDVLVVDAAAGVGSDVLSLLELADASIIVTTPEPTAIADAYALIKCAAARRGGSTRARQQGIGPRNARMALVVNQAREVREAVDVHRRINAVTERFLGFRVALLGAVAFDPAVGLAVRAKQPLLLQHAGSPAARDIAAVGASLAQLLRPRSTASTGRLSEAIRTGRREWSRDVRRRNR